MHYEISSFMICAPHQTLFEWQNQGRWGGRSMWHKWWRRLGRPKQRLDNRVKIHLKIIRWKAVGWIKLAQDRNKWQAVVNTVMNLASFLSAGNVLTICRGADSFLRQTVPRGLRYRLVLWLLFNKLFLFVTTRDNIHCRTYITTDFSENHIW